MHPPLLQFIFWFFIIVSLILLIAPKSAFANDGNYSSCSTRFRCGNIDTGYPFWGLERPEDCGYPGFWLNCSGNVPEITIMSVTYQVLNIESGTRNLRLARTDYSEDVCVQYLRNTTLTTGVFEYNSNTQNMTIYYGCRPLTIGQSLPRGLSSQFECEINGTENVGYYVTRNITESSFGELANLISTSLGSCNDSVTVPVLKSEVEVVENSRTTESLIEALKVGFELQWFANDSSCDSCIGSGGQCGYNQDSREFLCYCSGGSYLSTCPQVAGSGHLKLNLIIGLTVAAASVIVVICIVFFVIQRRKQNSTSNENSVHLRLPMNHNGSIEAFIKKYGCFAPKRYSYIDIKKMTNKFKDKLGQGGYGGVYKGKLPDGRLVAVKVRSESKGNGEEFMNEVASISRTSHVNIVTLLGFCYEISKRALVYEFMPHGSLDKFIYNQGSMNQPRQLEWKTLYDIALGIARGLEYLHQGCNTRILHFDIKPHNILLDESFCPKISDFGLSKLCERKNSIVSMTGARGTAGYIAPEVFCRNFGGVSHKSDVYSYGMMVLEMVGGRKNINVVVSQTSEVYFPSWIYEHLDQAMDLSLDGVTGEEEEEITRKLTVVSLWCIQTIPSDRPSMTKVLEMLTGSLQLLAIPPRPFVSSPVRSPKSSSPV